jgi:DNA-binding NarL/FixJ family response regulator
VSNEGVLDGFDILRSIRKSGEMKKGGLLARTRFVFLTNQGQSRDLKQALDMDADGYIIKASIMPDELVGLLRRVYKGNRKVVVMEQTELSQKSENRAA